MNISSLTQSEKAQVRDNQPRKWSKDIYVIFNLSKWSVQNDETLSQKQIDETFSPTQVMTW